MAGIDASPDGPDVDAMTGQSGPVVTVTVGGTGTGMVTSSPAGLDCPGTCMIEVAEGEPITLQASADPGSTFLGWTGGDCSGTGDCTLTVTGSASVEASFGLDNSLVVTKDGNGSGVITSDPGGIDCGSDCEEVFSAGETVLLTANPDVGSTFTGWAGGGCSGTDPCTVTLDAAAMVTGTFTLEPHDLTITKTGTGTGTITSDPVGIDCGSDCQETYDYGTSVTLTADAGTDSVFSGWTGGGCSGTGPCTVSVSAATDVTATFTLGQHVVSVTKGGNGSGAVTSSPAGIDCGSDCAESYESGTTVTLTASAATGSTFTGWSGGGCTGAGTCTVTVSGAVDVVATFTLDQHTLSLSKTGNGSGSVTSNPAGIDCGADCSQDYDYGTDVVLTASAGTGSTFTGWSGGGCSGSGTCTTSIIAATTVTATFQLDQHLLTVQKIGTGTGTVASSPTGITCGADCSEAYDYGTSVTLTPAAGTGSTFAGWSGGGCSGTGTCTVSMTAATTVTASFTLDQHTLTVSKTGTGSGSVTSSPAGISCGNDCTQTYNYGTSVSLTATPSTGSTFTGWSGGGCSGTGTCTVSMTAATSVTASFTLQTHTLTVTKSGTGSGSVTSSPAGISCGNDCTQTYTYGTSVTLTASASTGSTFTGWSGGGCSGTGTCTVSMTAATTVTAAFTLDQHPLSVVLGGKGTGKVSSNPAGISCGADCSESYGYGTSVTLTASPAIGSYFSGWSGGGCSGTSTSCTVTITAATSVAANFTPLSYQLSVFKKGSGGGTVTSSPFGISCGNDCSHTYSHGTSITLTASPASGSVFAGWSGGGCSGNGTCTVTLTQATSVTATFNVPLTCTYESNLSSCNISSVEINLGPLNSKECHASCQKALAEKSVTSGCWIVLGNGNCYCRDGGIGLSGSSYGGSCK